MAVVNTKSTNVTNADAAVQTQNPVHIGGGRRYGITGTIAIAAGDDDGSVLRLARVHSSWRILGVKIYNDAITGAATWGLTLYQTAANGGAAVGAGLYSAVVAVATASLVGAEVSYSAARPITKIGQTVWEDAGLTADPGRWYDLCLVATTAGTAAGNISWDIEFMQGAS